jgi:hypothetical protein
MIKAMVFREIITDMQETNSKVQNTHGKPERMTNIKSDTYLFFPFVPEDFDAALEPRAGAGGLGTTADDFNKDADVLARYAGKSRDW